MMRARSPNGAVVHAAILICIATTNRPESLVRHIIYGLELKFSRIRPL